MEHMSQYLSQSPAGRPPREKSTLFCPACGHDSPADGDWRVQTESDGVRYDCPVCDETITERPTWTKSDGVFDEPTPRTSILARSVRIAFAWTAWPYTQAECASS